MRDRRRAGKPLDAFEPAVDAEVHQIVPVAARFGGHVHGAVIAFHRRRLVGHGDQAGQEVASSVESVEVWDREDKKTKTLTNVEMQFRRLGGQGDQAARVTQHEAMEVGVGGEQIGPAADHAHGNAVGVGLQVNLGDRMPIGKIRNAVLGVRAGKGMLEDATRYSAAGASSLTR